MAPGAEADVSEQALDPRYRRALDDAWRAVAALLDGGVVPLPDLVRHARWRYRRAWRAEQLRVRGAPRALAWGLEPAAGR
jgi:hypothetical protein